MDIEIFLETYGLLAIFGVMLLKAIGVPIPIPADALMLATSARVASGRLEMTSAFVALLVALTVGGVIQFWLMGAAGRGVILRFGRYLGITAARLDAASNRMERAGVPGVALAVLTPGIRSVAVIACGVAHIPLRLFAPGLLIGSGMFLALHFFLGYIGGALLTSLNALVPTPAWVGGLIALLAAGFGVWYVIRRRQRPQDTPAQVAASALGAWHEATCPACLALGALNRLQIDLPAYQPHPLEGDSFR